MNNVALGKHMCLCVAKAPRALAVKAHCCHVSAAAPQHSYDVLPVLFHLPEDKQGTVVLQSSYPNSQQSKTKALVSPQEAKGSSYHGCRSQCVEGTAK